MANYTLTVTTYVGNPTVPWVKPLCRPRPWREPRTVPRQRDALRTLPATGARQLVRKATSYAKRTEWDVEAAWSKERYERYAASGFEGDGPNQFRTEQDVIDTAAARFARQAA